MTQTEALKLALEALERIDLWLKARYSGIGLVGVELEAITAIKEALAQPEQDKERCVGCEACIDTACGRDECPKGWPKAAQPEQEPVAWIDLEKLAVGGMAYATSWKTTGKQNPLYTTPPQRKPLTDEMIVAGGKALAKLHAESCGLDFDDVWKYYAEDHKADAKAAIEAAHGIKE